MTTWDRGAPTQVVQNTHQARQEKDTGPQWACPRCGNINGSLSSHCSKCSALKPEERLLRQQVRAGQGLGRGGGYFERDDDRERKDDKEENVKGGLDIYGRVRTTHSSEEGGGSSGAGARNALTSVGHVPTKAERQKAALERLRKPKAKKESLSPPRTRIYREKSSRSRSRERRKNQQRGYISGGAAHG
eukprot:TRINITY_DN115553_c0_g1_i1.p1 TRINITY_DN115553_c0_g1~~TRINITY_DN115553_c0_g1_i1.p1  ORF type:complete len:189 (+),score=42.35 TRINITY_DN115553_c0_g1_i1:76-642(+)